MATAKKYLPPEETKADTAHAVARAVVGSIPVVGSAAEDNPYLFPGKYGLPGRYRENMGTPSLIWKEVLKQAKIKDIKPHDLRHSWAAFALASGLSLADVGQQLNHKTYQTTKRYEHLANEVKQRNVAKVSEAIQSMSSGSAKIIDIRDVKNNAK